MDVDPLVLRIAKGSSAEDLRNFRKWDLLHKEGSPLWALLYLSLFWPPLCEVDGMVFLSEHVQDDEDLQSVRALHRELSSHEVERRINTTELTSVFGKHAADGSESDYDTLTRALASLWSARLQDAYPQRRFVVEIVPPDEANDEAITFYQSH